LFVHVSDSVVDNINTEPSAVLTILSMLLSQLVQNISRVHARVVSKLSGDDFQSLSKGIDNKLGLALDLTKVFSKITRKLHLDSTATGNDGAGLDCTTDNHNSIIERALSLINVLVCTTSENNSARLGSWAPSEEIVSLSTNLNFLEITAGSENILGEAVDCCLDNTSGGLSKSQKIITGNSSSTEEVSVSEELGSKIADRKLGQDNLSTAGNNLIELFIDQFPFSIDNLLEVIGVLKTDLGIILLSLELQLNIQKSNLGLFEFLWLLFEASIREGLLEGDSLYQE
jgi:hypothetical protein